MIKQILFQNGRSAELLDEISEDEEEIVMYMGRKRRLQESVMSMERWGSAWHVL